MVACFSMDSGVEMDWKCPYKNADETVLSVLWSLLYLFALPVDASSDLRVVL